MMRLTVNDLFNKLNDWEGGARTIGLIEYDEFGRDLNIVFEHLSKRYEALRLPRVKFPEEEKTTMHWRGI